MTATLFLAFLGLIAGLVITLIARYIGTRAALCVLAGLTVWFLYAGLMGYFGVVRDSALRPPGILFIVVPVVLFLVVFLLRVRSSGAALSFPLWILIGTQSFRIGVELFLHQLWIEGVVPKTLTFEGANMDIFIGASAPFIALLCVRGGSLANKAALAWNVLGLLALANVVTRSVLTAPGPFNLIHAEVPNMMMSTFPYLFIPAFFVPLAVVLHILAIKSGLKAKLLPLRP